MKILLCSNVYPPYFIGGAELIAHFQAKAIQSLGHEVVVFAGDPVPHGGQPNGPRHSIRCEDYQGLKVYRTCLEGIDYQAEYANFFHAKVEDHFIDVISRFKPDIVHCHNIIGLSVGLIDIAKQYGAKVVLTAHDHWGFCLKNTLIKRENEVCQDFSKCHECLPYFLDEETRFPVRLRRDYLKTQLNKVDLLISPSRYLANSYIASGFPANKVKVIINGVDIAKFGKVRKAPSQGKMRFSYIGYLGNHKGITTLLDSLNHLDQNNKERVSINLVGVGEMSDNYQQQVRQAGNTHLVRFWGKVDNNKVEEVYEQTDVLVLPSIWPENQPVTITEAMACSTPIIGSAIGGIPELIEDGKTGYLVKPGDPREIAEKMTLFLSNPESVSRLGKAGHQKFSHYSFKRQADEIVTNYHKLLGENKPSSKENNEEAALLICLGNEVSDACEAIMGEFSDSNIRFVMKGWCQDESLKNAKLTWVINESVTLKQTYQVCKHRLPLLVPEQNQQLKELCRRYNCGLYYRSSDEAIHCIYYLLNNPVIARKLGQNAYQWVLDSVHSSVQKKARPPIEH